ncbi:MAG: ABC transporter permease, partial [Planctomycetota bacterium]
FTLVAVALRSIRARSVRSFLTMLTAAVGIAGVTSSMALMDGITFQIARDVRSLGVRVVEVLNPSVFKGYPGIPDVPLGKEHLDALRAAFPDIPVVPTRIGFYVAKVKEREKPFFAVGVGTDHNMRATFDVGMEKGRFFDAAESSTGARVCVLDSALAKEAFGETDPIGRTIDLTFGFLSFRLTVIGVMEDPFSLREHLELLDSFDPARMAFARLQAYRNIYFPIEILPGGSEVIHTVKIPAPTVQDVEPVFEEVKAIMGEDLSKMCWTLKSWADVVVKTTHEFNLLGNLFWVALLFVTGVLIGTVNLIAIRERFHEVGVRLTEGARPWDIWLQLTVENCLLSLAGGALGIVLGFPTAWVLAEFIAKWEPAFTAKGVILPIAVAVLLGILSTLWPAWKASRLQAVDILRKR